MKKFILFFILIFSSSCSWIAQKNLGQEYYLKNKELVVLVRNNPISYYEDRFETTAGFEHDSIQSFARKKDVQVRFIVKETKEELLEDLRLGRAHMAMGVFIAQDLEKQFLLGPPILSLNFQLFCPRDYRPLKLKQLSGKKISLVVEDEAGSEVKSLRESFPEVEWQLESELSVRDIIEKVNQKKVNCVVADSLIWRMNQPEFAKLKRMKESFGDREIVWVMGARQKKLRKDLLEWHKNFFQSHQRSSLFKQYFSVNAEYDNYDTEVFLKRISSRLEPLKKYFKVAADQFGFDWRFLAAVAYQESHWNKNAVSPTGVRGIMMLIKKTAEELGVDNRLDPEQSIFGGAKYLRQMIERMPYFMSEEDRLWFGLASYNLGYYHVVDARKLAIDQKLNPNRWQDVKSILPFLSQSRYYRKLRHGFARGQEAVTYVRRIRRYYNLLKVEFFDDDGAEEKLNEGV